MIKLNRYFLPYDIYERHKKVGEFIEDGKTVLDVGGELNQLSSFCNPQKIVVANLEESQEKSDIKLTGRELPFKNNSFDIVTAIDVLEHIPQAERGKFIRDLFKVCREKLILSFPIGTPKHDEYENKIQKWLEGKNMDVGYLKEHILFKLPTKTQIDSLTKGQKVMIFFSGNLMLNEYIFKIYLFDPKVKIVRKLVFYFKKMLNLVTNDIFYSMLANKNYSTNVVRAYLIISKK